MSKPKFMFLRQEGDGVKRKGDFTQESLPPTFDAIGDRVIHEPKYMMINQPMDTSDEVQKPTVKKFSSRNQKKRM